MTAKPALTPVEMAQIAARIMDEEFTAWDTLRDGICRAATVAAAVRLAHRAADSSQPPFDFERIGLLMETIEHQLSEALMAYHRVDPTRRQKADPTPTSDV